MFDGIVNSIVAFVVEWQVFIYALIVITFVVTGIMFALGGSFRDRAKENLVYIVIAVVFVMGAVQFADALYNSMQF